MRQSYGVAASLAVCVVFVGAMLAAQQTPESVSPGSSKVIEAFGDCKKIENTHDSGKPLMVPTGSQAEWEAFLNNSPSGVQISPCDTAPDPFDFKNQTGVEASVIVESNTVTITGIDAPVDVSLSGDGSPETLVDGIRRM